MRGTEGIEGLEYGEESETLSSGPVQDRAHQHSVMTGRSSRGFTPPEELLAVNWEGKVIFFSVVTTGKLPMLW